MKKPFKVGERIRVFGTRIIKATGNACGGSSDAYSGYIEHIIDDCMVCVSIHDCLYYVNPKQCRRLTSKPKRQKVTREQLERWRSMVNEHKTASFIDNLCFNSLCNLVLGKGK